MILLLFIFVQSDFSHVRIQSQKKPIRLSRTVFPSSLMVLFICAGGKIHFRCSCGSPGTDGGAYNDYRIPTLKYFNY